MVGVPKVEQKKILQAVMAKCASDHDTMITFNHRLVDYRHDNLANDPMTLSHPDS